jgi:hypothetical protein
MPRRYPPGGIGQRDGAIDFIVCERGQMSIGIRQSGEIAYGVIAIPVVPA